MDGTVLPYVDVNGARLRYIDKGQGPTVLLIHGLGATHADWEKQLDVLARIFRIIAPDLRGHGSSEGEGPYAIERFATDLGQLLDLLKITRVAIIGHSMGGAVAMQMALSKPERVQKLILADTLPDFRPHDFSQKWMVWSRVMTMRLWGAKVLAERSAKKMFPKPEQEALRELSVLRNSSIRKSVYLETLASLSKWSIADKLSWLSMPVLVTAGDHDYFPPQAAQAFAEALPNGQCRILEGAHHHLPLERAEDFNRLVQEFLMPGSSLSQGKGDVTLNWLRVDPKEVKAIDVNALLRRPGEK